MSGLTYSRLTQLFSILVHSMKHTISCRNYIIYEQSTISSIHLLYHAKTHYIIQTLTISSKNSLYISCRNYICIYVKAHVTIYYMTYI